MRILSCRFVMWRSSFVTLSQPCKNPLSWILLHTSLLFIAFCCSQNFYSQASCFFVSSFHFALRKIRLLNYRVCTSSNFISDCFRNLAFSSYVHLTSLRLRLITLPIIRLLNFDSSKPKHSTIGLCPIVSFGFSLWRHSFVTLSQPCQNPQKKGSEWSRTLIRERDREKIFWENLKYFLREFERVCEREF